MKINGNAVRPGYIIEHQGRLWRAVRIMHTQPGKGGAYLQVELKDIRDGTKLNERFRSREADQFTFMESETFEQIALPEDMIGEPAIFLTEGMTVRIMSYEGEPISVELPDTVTLRVVEADPVVKGQTAASSYKSARLENGVRTLVPPHVEAGIRVVVNTADGAYVERAKD